MHATTKIKASLHFAVTAASLALSFVLTGCAASASPPSTTLAPALNLPKPDHVVIVLEENKDYSTIIGSANAPYINQLANSGALFTDSHGLEHPSQPNYIQLFSGSTYGITNDNPPKQQFSAPSLRSTLAAANLTFCGYSESLPSVGSMTVKTGLYARKHCPWTDFADVPPTENVPFEGYFPTTPDGFSKLPTVSFVTPNMDNDMHDGTVAQGDVWLKQNLSAYADWAKTHNSLLIVTFDEDEGSQPNHIPTIFVGQMVHPGVYTDRITHYNVLRTVEDMYKLPPLGESTATASIGNVWTDTTQIAATTSPTGAG